MKKIVLAAFVLAVGLPAAAQDTYESARLLGEDLNGTARYVGMGGAMEALGADISTIGSNPAGIGLFRHSTVSMSLGFVSQQDAQKFDGLGKTNMSFDQAGFVYSTRTSSQSYMNFAFNYHKNRNFDQILSAANRLRDVSSNALTYNKAARGSVNAGGYDLAFNSQGDLVGWESSSSEYRAQTYSTLDYLNANSVLLDADYEKLIAKGATAHIEVGSVTSTLTSAAMRTTGFSGDSPSEYITLTTKATLSTVREWSTAKDWMPVFSPTVMKGRSRALVAISLPVSSTDP